MIVQPSIAHTSALLNQIAENLGLPVEAFRGDAPSEAEDLLMLVQLWLSIKDGQARQRVLALTRQEAERAGGTGTRPGAGDRI